MISKVRATVSKDRNRYRLGMWDLDLTYITNRIVAMSFPASGLESAFRNDINEVAKMLQTHHRDHFLIWNLSERSYDYSLFDGKVLDMGWPDHHSPPLRTLMQIMTQMDEFLRKDALNVSIVHCLAAGSAVSFSHGLSYPIEDLSLLVHAPQLVCWDGQNVVADGRASDFLPQPPRGCIQLELMDGRTLRLTPDHRILFRAGAGAPINYIEAELAATTSGGAVVCSSLEGVLDQPFSQEGESWLYMPDAFEARMSAMAIFRLFGVQLAKKESPFVCSPVLAASFAEDLKIASRFAPAQMETLCRAWLVHLVCRQRQMEALLLGSLGRDSPSLSNGKAVSGIPPCMLREAVATWWGAGVSQLDPMARIGSDRDVMLGILGVLRWDLGIAARFRPRNGTSPSFLARVEGCETRRQFAERVGVRYNSQAQSQLAVYRAYLRARALGHVSGPLADFCRRVRFLWGGGKRFLEVPVVRSTKVGPAEPVFDLSVPGTHNFVANGVLVHNCMAGKGRTGTAIASYLLYSGIVKTAAEAVQTFGRARSALELGVEQPSQKRYVTYMESLLRHQMYPSVVRRVIRRIEMGPPPPINKATQSVTLLLQVCQTSRQPEVLLYSNQWLTDRAEVQNGRELSLPSYSPSDRLIVLDLSVPVQGDITIRGFHVHGVTLKPIFRTAFHTAFVDQDELYLEKADLDLAYKNKKFDSKFFLRVEFVPGESDEPTFDPAWTPDTHSNFLASRGLFSKQGSRELTALPDPNDDLGLDIGLGELDLLEFEQALDVIQMNLMDVPNDLGSGESSSK